MSCCERLVRFLYIEEAWGKARNCPLHEYSAVNIEYSNYTWDLPTSMLAVYRIPS
jgi:hypothetical protein